MFFQLAWRNLWRNPKRTLILLTAVVIGIWAMIVIGTLMRGISAQMVRHGIATLTGHVQIHRLGYRADPVVENSILDPQKVTERFPGLLPAGTRWAPRIRVPAIAGNARHTAGVNLVGIDPLAEKGVSFIGTAVAEGEYLKPEDERSILIGKALADQFDTGLGKKLVLMSQDTNQEIASRAYRISGIYRAELEATEKEFVFVTLPAAAGMLRLGRGISEISLLFPAEGISEAAAARLRDTFAGTDLEISTWRQLLAMISGVLELYDGIIFIWFLVIFVAMGFGIVNTFLMAVLERLREFGLLKALGMKPGWIVRQVLVESLLLLLIGQIVGSSLGLLSYWGLARTGIDLSAVAEGMEYVGMTRMIFPVLLPRDALTANLVVFLLGLLVSVYPAVKAGKVTPAKALAGG
ncbi:MAG: ABC transporter permease [Desulfuromonadaceae bacterium]|nr:ABC transporter permease [Desulfuromonadaceae bacterium]